MVAKSMVTVSVETDWRGTQVGGRFNGDMKTSFEHNKRDIRWLRRRNFDTKDYEAYCTIAGP